MFAPLVVGEGLLAAEQLVADDALPVNLFLSAKAILTEQHLEAQRREQLLHGWLAPPTIAVGAPSPDISQADLSRADKTRQSFTPPDSCSDTTWRRLLNSQRTRSSASDSSSEVAPSRASEAVIQSASRYCAAAAARAALSALRCASTSVCRAARFAASFACSCASSAEGPSAIQPHTQPRLLSNPRVPPGCCHEKECVCTLLMCRDPRS